MNLTGLLLGAGASFDIGMPLVKELRPHGGHRDLKRYMTPDKLQSRNLWQKSRRRQVAESRMRQSRYL